MPPVANTLIPTPAAAWSVVATVVPASAPRRGQRGEVPERGFFYVTSGEVLEFVLAQPHHEVAPNKSDRGRNRARGLDDPLEPLRERQIVRAGQAVRDDGGL